MNRGCEEASEGLMRLSEERASNRESNFCADGKGPEYWRGTESVPASWIHKMDPIELLRDANESSKSWLPFGIGFAIDHPAVLASSEFLEIAALDPVVRVGKAAFDLGVQTPYNVLQDLGSSAKDLLETGQELGCAAIDFITMHPHRAAQDVKHGLGSAVRALEHLGEALVVDPIEGIVHGVMDIL